MINHIASKVTAYRQKLNTVWGLADQALLSASNFTMMLLLARHLGVDQFGTFVIVYAAVIFANGLQGDLFTQPFMVLGAGREEHESKVYATSVGLTLVCFSLAIASLFALVGFLLGNVGQSVVGNELLAISPLVVTWQAQEFVRRILYAKSELQKVFFLDLLSYGGQILAVLFLWQVGSIGSTSVLLAMSFTFAVGLVWGLYQVRSSFTRHVGFPTIRFHMRENWRFGRWLMGGTIAYWLSSQLFAMLAAGFVSVAAAGGIRMAQNLVAPTNILTRTTDTIGTPRAAMARHQEGPRGMLLYLRRIASPGLVLMLLFVVPVAILARPIISLLAGPEYLPYAWLVSVLAVVFVLEYLATVAGVAVKSLGDTVAFMVANTSSAALVMTLGTWAVWEFGLPGAAAGMIIHSLIVNVVLWSRIRSRVTVLEVQGERLARA